jgi:hypothetical protein
MTADQYRESWAGGPPVAPPPGLIFHAGIGDGAAFFTVTVWESRAAYDTFAAAFAQAMAARGFEFGRPEVLPVHNFFHRPPDTVDERIRHQLTGRVMKRTCQLRIVNSQPVDARSSRPSAPREKGAATMRDHGFCRVTFTSWSGSSA